MPVSKERYAENQRARRLAARPCMVCGEKGKATESHTAAPGAAVVRCCQPCYAVIAGLPDSPVAPIESQPDISLPADAADMLALVKEQSDVLADILKNLPIAFRPAGIPGAEQVTPDEIIAARRYIYSIAAMEHYDPEDAYLYADKRATAEVTREQAQAQAQAEIDNGESLYAVLAFDTPEPKTPFQVYPPRPPAG